MEDKLIDKITACSKKVFDSLGPGFTERIYHNALKVALDDDKVNFNSDDDFSIFYKDERVGSFRCDLFVENKILVIIKSHPNNELEEFGIQMKSYLKAAEIKVGLVLNFGLKGFTALKV